MEPVTATTGTPLLPAADTESRNGILNQEDFLEIMIAELANQDPFEPLDNREFLGQLTQMQSLEATTALTESLESLVLSQQISSAGSLLGQQVRGRLPNGVELTGIVDRIVVDSGEVLIGVNGTNLPLANVTEVTAAPQTEEASG